jgi:hypothetical protein
MTESHKEPPLETEPLTVDIVDSEIVVDGSGSGAPSLTSDAARKTAVKLTAAADKVDGKSKTRL